MGDIKQLTQKIKKFRDERGWMQFHNHKDMALSLVLEAGEVLEHFQWKSPKEIEKHVRVNKSEVEEKIADVAIYLFELADNLKINLALAMRKKLEKNAKKYPIEKAKGRNTKYNKL